MVRIKYRYFLCEIVAEDFLNPKQMKLTFSQSSILLAIKKAIEMMHGDYGAGVTQLALAIKTYNPYTRVFLLRAKRAHHTIVSASLPFVTQIDSTLVSLRLLHLGGTIRTCLNFLISFDQDQLLLLSSEYKSEQEKNEIQTCMKTNYRVLGVENSDSE